MADKEDEARKKQAAFWLEYSQQLSTAIRYTEALSAAERAVSLDETSAPVWYVKGTCLAMMAQYEAAATDFKHALALDPLYVPAWDGKAWVLLPWPHPYVPIYPIPMTYRPSRVPSI